MRSPRRQEDGGLPRQHDRQRRAGGSSWLLDQVRRSPGQEDTSLLLGTDLVKDPARQVAAYDAAGVTAQFNRNVLHVHQP